MVVRVGDTIPDFRAPSSHGQTLDRESFLGKLPIAFVVVSDLASATGQSVVGQLDEHLVDFGHARVQLLVVVPASPRDLRRVAEERSYALTLLADEAALHAADDSLSSALVGVLGRDEIGVVVVDAHGTVRHREVLGEIGGSVERVLECALALSTFEPD
jgi:peroxiredoxin